MQKIVPHLWFEKGAVEAAAFYSSVFSNSEIVGKHILSHTPSGESDVASFTVNGYRLVAFNAGPYAKFNPSVSLMVHFDPAADPEAEKRIQEAWDSLVEGGRALMEIQEYPFSPRYGWLEDRYGVSWQLMLASPDRKPTANVHPALLFTRELAGKVDEAADYYCSVFDNTERGLTARYGENPGPDSPDSVLYCEFKLEDQWFSAMDSSHPPGFEFNESISFMVVCQDQEEVDRYWSVLSAKPENEQCGWLKDRYGVSWQIVPQEFVQMMESGTPEQIGRLTEAFMQMHKLEIEPLRSAFRGEG